MPTSPKLLLPLALTLLPGLAAAQTMVPSGNLVGSQTWTAAGSPYVVQGDLTVPAGITLTLEAGAVVHLGPGDDQAANADSARAELRVAGTLTVNGTAGSPAVVRSGAATPGPSDFYGVVFLAGATVSGSNLRVERGLRGISNAATGAALSQVALHDCNRGVTTTAGTLTLTGGEVLRSASYGVSVEGGRLDATGLEVANGSNRGVHVAGGDLAVDHSVIRNNSSYGVYATSGSGSNTVLLDHVSVYGNSSYGAYVAGNSSLAFTLRSSMVAANGTYGVYRSSSAGVTLAANLVWNNGTNYSGVSPSADSRSENPLLVSAATGDLRPTSNSGLRSAGSDGQDIGALPYDGVATSGLLGHLFVDTVLTAAASPHTVSGDLTVEPGVTLTVQPGAEVRFTASADQMDAGDNTTLAELRVQGRLLANGTVGAPILFGSTNTTRGSWYGLRLLGTTTQSSVDYATIQFARYGIHSSAPAGNTLRRTTVRESSSYALYVDSGVTTFDQMIIRDNGNRGAYFAGGGGLTNSLVFDNASYGVYATSAATGTTLALTHNTIADNGSYGVYIAGNSSLGVTLRDNIIVNNGTYGVYRSSSAGVTDSYNLVWSNGTEYSGVSPGTGSVAENPLFVDQAGSDYRVGSRSPARLHGSGGTDIGALPHDGTATPQLLGHLYVDTLLTAAASPHVVPGDLTVEPGVTLAIEPGAVLRFASGADQMGGGADATDTELRVLGTLVADGTTSQGITFTSNAASPARGDWYGIHLMASSSNSILDFATVEFARYAVRSTAPSGTVVQRSTLRESSSYALYADGGAASFDQLVIRDNANRGAYLGGASGALTNSLIYGNSSYGVYLTSGSGSNGFNLTDNTIADNGSYGVYVAGNSSLSVTLRNNIIAHNGTYGVYRSSSAGVTDAYNLVWGNGTEYSGVSPGTGALSENPLFVSRAADDYRLTSRSPARLHASDGGDIGALAFDGAPTVGEQGHLYSDTTWAAAASPITVLGDITVGPGATLTIEPGVQVNFTPSADSMGANAAPTLTELIVAGRLQVNGSAGSRVVLTTGAASPARGQWYGVRLLGTAANSSIRNAYIRYARYGVQSSAPASASVAQSEIDQSSSYALYVDGGAATFDGLYIHDNGNRGVYVGGASPSLDNLVVTANASYGIYVTSGSGSNTVTINHASVNGNTSYGLYIAGNSALSVNLRNSIITNNGTYGLYRSSSAQVTLGINNVWNNGTNFSGVSAPAGTLSANAQFVDTALGNYQLLPSSTMIDAADPATALTSDLEGTGRPLDGDGNGSAVADLGALEFNPSSNRWPIADAGPDRVATSGLPITFDASGSVDPDGTIATYAWDFGDGATGAGLSVTHTFTGGTDRTVTLTVTDNAGAQDVDTAFVEVNLPPTAEAGPPKFGDPGEIISFTASGSTDSDGSIVTYAWDFGDGTSGSGQSVTHQYGAPGAYTVTLTVTDDDGATGLDTTTVSISGNDAVPPAIVHAPVTNGQPAGQPVTVSASITDASGVASATLYYRAIGAGAFSTAAMSNTAGATYQGTVPGGAVNAPGVEYYLAASDNAAPANGATQPSGAPTAYFTFTVTAPAAPAITHTPVGNGQPQGQAVTVTADITAQAGLTSTTLHYRPQGGGAFTSVALSNTAGSTYQAQIPGAAVSPPVMEYYLEATDGAGQTTTQPSGGGVHAFTVTPSDTSAPSITHVPITNGQPAGQPVTITADVTDVSGVSQVRLHYRVTGGGTYAASTMTAAGSTYSATIPAGSVTTAGVQYYLSASDGVAPPNSGTAPAGAPGAVYAFTVVRVFDVGPGDLVISEVMADPSGSETDREWFEVYNTTGDAIDLDGLTFSDDGVDAFTVNNGGPLLIASGGYLVFGRNPSAAANGGVAVDYVYTGMALANSTDELVISAGAVEVDRVVYDAGATFPRTPGRAISLDPLALDATTNDAGGSWCAATSLLSGGDFGTPGQENDSCQDTTPPTIVHTPIASGQQANLPVAVSAVVTDDTAVGPVELYYRVRGAGTFTAATMADIGSDVFQAEIPAAAVTTAGVEYYLRARDAAATANETLEPPTAPAQPYAFDVTPDDTSGPAINHNRIASPQPAATDLEVIASVADPSGVQQAELHFRVSGQGWQVAALTDLGQDVYRGTIPAAAVTAAGVEYYLTALDGLGHAAALPAAGETAPYTVAVVEADVTPPVIVHTPVADGRPRGVAVPVVAQVTDASGVAEVRLYFRASGDATFLSAIMTAEAQDEFRGELPAALVDGAGVDYYLEASDASDEQNTARDPEAAPATVHSFTIEDPTNPDDLDGPSILHLPPADGQAAGAALTLVAEVADPSGVAGMQVFLRRKGDAELSALAMTRVGGTDRWELAVPGALLQVPGLEYYLEATDGAPAGNTATRPPSAPAELFSFTVTAGGDPSPTPSPREETGCSCAARSAGGGAPWQAALLVLGLAALRRRRR